jgi:hypothetical protein
VTSHMAWRLAEEWSSPSDLLVLTKESYVCV